MYICIYLYICIYVYMYICIYKTSTDFAIDAKLNWATTKPVRQFVNVLDGVSKIRIVCPKKGRKIRELYLKQGQGLSGAAVPSYPGILSSSSFCGPITQLPHLLPLSLVTFQ